VGQLAAAKNRRKFKLLSGFCRQFGETDDVPPIRYEELRIPLPISNYASAIYSPYQTTKVLRDTGLIFCTP
jgi:hypothetical protein